VVRARAGRNYNRPRNTIPAVGTQFDPKIVSLFVRHISEKGYELVPAEDS
jgi:hypothetical protein